MHFFLVILIFLLFLYFLFLFFFHFVVVAVVVAVVVVFIFEIIFFSYAPAYWGTPLSWCLILHMYTNENLLKSIGLTWSIHA